MKKSLLASVAAAVLIAGPAFAQKQEAPASDVKGAAPPPAAVQNAPAEKIAPSGRVAPDRAAQDKAPASTTGQATSSPRSGDSKAADQPATKSDTKATDKPGAQSGSNAQSKPDERSGTTAQGGAAARPSGASVNLTTEQKDKVRTTVLRGGGAPRVTNINFSLNVGTVVPRTVRVVAVPPTLVEIHPAWRGFMYFVYNDQIVIVEPGTLKIVTVIVV